MKSIFCLCGFHIWNRRFSGQTFHVPTFVDQCRCGKGRILMTNEPPEVGYLTKCEMDQWKTERTLRSRELAGIAKPI